MNKKRSLLILLPILISSCAPRPITYTDHVQAEIISGSIVNTRVSAAAEEWRNSGLIVNKGHVYHITADGRWRTHGTCNFTGPNGIGLYQGFCAKSPLYPEIIKGYSHSILIAKIGETGIPFPVGADYQLKAAKSGVLLFRINDTVNTNFDNEGFVDVKIDTTASHNGEKIQSIAQHSPSGLSAINTNKARTALVIGNSAYKYGPLKNPVNDAKAVATQLMKIGFDVILKLDVNQESMEDALDLFGRKLSSGDQVALFYYAGHGVQVGGDNYLIPIGAKIKRQSDVRYKAVNIGQILGSMGETEDNLNIVILDACRDNPLPRSFRSSSRGLARVEGPKGTILGFATSPGSVASDGDGENGVYTKHLLQNMRKPGLSIEQVFKDRAIGFKKS